jgi:hypothetical protein
MPGHGIAGLFECDQAWRPFSLPGVGCPLN